MYVRLERGGGEYGRGFEPGSKVFFFFFFFFLLTQNAGIVRLGMCERVIS